MMLQLPPQTRTTLAVRSDIARSLEPISVLARRYGIRDETGGIEELLIGVLAA